ncbi:MAG: hypothetical protein J07HQW1_01711, partial [Haloquadratum walsbyi J07HQW1]
MFFLHTRVEYDVAPPVGVTPFTRY